MIYGSEPLNSIFATDFKFYRGFRRQENFYVEKRTYRRNKNFISHTAVFLSSHE